VSTFHAGLLFKDCALSYYLSLKSVYDNFKAHCLLALTQTSTLWPGKDIQAAIRVVQEFDFSNLQPKHMRASTETAIITAGVLNQAHI
jgi:hypothetical protein